MQLYFQPTESDQPVRLVGWKAVEVAAGQSARVTVTTDERLWRKWNTATNSWDKLAGGGELLIARGLGDVRATVPLA